MTQKTLSPFAEAEAAGQVYTWAGTMTHTDGTVEAVSISTDSEWDAFAVRWTALEGAIESADFQGTFSDPTLPSIPWQGEASE